MSCPLMKMSGGVFYSLGGHHLYLVWCSSSQRPSVYYQSLGIDY